MFQKFIRAVTEGFWVCWVALCILHSGLAEAAKVDIIFFSHTGNSKLVAESFQKGLKVQATLTEIYPTHPYPKYDELMAIAEKEAGNPDCRPEYYLVAHRTASDGQVEPVKLDKKTIDFDSSQCVIIIMPVWHYKIPKVVLNFLEHQDWTHQKVILITTHHGFLGSCQEDFKEAIPGAELVDSMDFYFPSSPGDGTISDKEVKRVIQRINKLIAWSDK